MHHGAKVPIATFQFNSLVLFSRKRDSHLVWPVLSPYGLVTSKEDVSYFLGKYHAKFNGCILQSMELCVFFFILIHSFCDQNKGESHATVTVLMTMR